MAVDPPFRIKNMVPGMIMLWHGAVVDIPSGWHLCDGTMGTPDLGARFVLAVGNGFTPGDKAGSFSHTHTFTGDGHFHTHDPGMDFAISAGINLNTTVDPAAGTTDVGISIPPYYVLAYIMKL